MASRRHFVARFFGTLVPRRVSPPDRAWIAAILEPHELGLWSKLGRADAVESVGVARRADADLAPSDPHRNDVLAAALLHDVGKLDAHLPTLGRVAATIAGGIAGHNRAVAWQQRRGIVRRFGLYLQHASLGEQRIAIAGGRDVAARWAGAHHDPARWSTVGLPIEHCRLLAHADGEDDS